MSTPKGSGARGRLRLGGLALFALAIIAVIIGMLVAVNRDEQTTTTGKPPVTPTDVPGSPSVVPSVIPYPPPVPSFPEEAPAASPSDTASPPGVVSLPGAESSPGSVGAAQGPVDDKDFSRGAVRIYNNSTIRGLAAQAADDLSAAGWTVDEVGNYARGTIPTTTVYYQEGTDEQAAAESIGVEFGMRVEPRFPGIADSSPGVIVIVTNDYSG